jgi:hypothetical protein
MSAGVPIQAHQESQPCVLQCQTVSSFSTEVCELKLFFRPRLDGTFANCLLCCGVASTLCLASGRHQRGVSAYS